MIIVVLGKLAQSIKTHFTLFALYFIGVHAILAIKFINVYLGRPAPFQLENNGLISIGFVRIPLN